MLFEWKRPRYGLSCIDIGDNGGCGENCPVLLRGECSEIENDLDKVEKQIKEGKVSLKHYLLKL